MKKAIALISVLLGVVFLTGCGQQLTSQTQPTTLAPAAQQKEQPITATGVSAAMATSATTTCDNYQCLISAASQCQPISVTISYSNTPFPLNPEGMFASGQIKYEIIKSSGANDCTLVFSNPATVLSLTDKGRKDALASGMTDAQITAQLQTMNDSAKATAGAQATCLSSASAISDYLADTQKGTSNIASNGQTTTYTTTSGQKLVCTTVLPTLPLQPANTSVTITNDECIAKKGSLGTVTDVGTACLENQVDLGMIAGVKVNGKYNQCCAPK